MYADVMTYVSRLHLSYGHALLCCHCSSCSGITLPAVWKHMSCLILGDHSFRRNACTVSLCALCCTDKHSIRSCRWQHFTLLMCGLKIKSFNAFGKHSKHGRIKGQQAVLLQDGSGNSKENRCVQGREGRGRGRGEERSGNLEGLNLEGAKGVPSMLTHLQSSSKIFHISSCTL